MKKVGFIFYCVGALMSLLCVVFYYVMTFFCADNTQLIRDLVLPQSICMLVALVMWVVNLRICIKHKDHWAHIVAMVLLNLIYSPVYAVRAIMKGFVSFKKGAVPPIPPQN